MTLIYSSSSMLSHGSSRACSAREAAHRKLSMRREIFHVPWPLVRPAKSPACLPKYTSLRTACRSVRYNVIAAATTRSCRGSLSVYRGKFFCLGFGRGLRHGGWGGALRGQTVRWVGVGKYALGIGPEPIGSPQGGLCSFQGSCSLGVT